MPDKVSSTTPAARRPRPDYRWCHRKFLREPLQDQDGRSARFDEAGLGWTKRHDRRRSNQMAKTTENIGRIAIRADFPSMDIADATGSPTRDQIRIVRADRGIEHCGLGTRIDRDHPGCDAAAHAVSPMPMRLGSACGMDGTAFIRLMTSITRPV